MPEEGEEGSFGTGAGKKSDALHGGQRHRSERRNRQGPASSGGAEEERGFPGNPAHYPSFSLASVNLPIIALIAVKFALTKSFLEANLHESESREILCVASGVQSQEPLRPQFRVRANEEVDEQTARFAAS
jgi:hypothetical protein